MSIVRTYKRIKHIIDKRSQNAQILSALIQALILLIASVVFPYFQNKFEANTKLKEQLIARKERIFDDFTSSYQKYYTNYSRYILLSIFVSNNTGTTYLGMPREKASELRIKILELLVSLPAPEAMAAYISTYYTGEDIHKNIKKLIDYNNRLTALDPSDPQSDKASQDIIRNIEVLYNELVKEMAEETKADIKTKG